MKRKDEASELERRAQAIQERHGMLSGTFTVDVRELGRP
jgi:hypothetical protein